MSSAEILGILFGPSNVEIYAGPTDDAITKDPLTNTVSY